MGQIGPRRKKGGENDRGVERHWVVALFPGEKKIPPPKTRREGKDHTTMEQNEPLFSFTHSPFPNPTFPYPFQGKETHLDTVRFKIFWFNYIFLGSQGRGPFPTPSHSSSFLLLLLLFVGLAQPPKDTSMKIICKVRLLFPKNLFDLIHGMVSWLSPSSLNGFSPAKSRPPG